MKPKITCTLIKPGQAYLQLSVDVFQPITKNSTGSTYKGCKVELCFSQGNTWKNLEIIDCSPRELSDELRTKVQLLCILPTDERHDNRQAEVQVHTGYSGELTVSSDKKIVEIPSLSKSV